ncbi:ABC transporter substrate-binding protein [Anaerocolumna sp. MB42-C2]|uniref:ABC transporter substrate-binding protein n=1 Tax=Anaerocolumna sp. MB42-C2 TaxID=3070997 RepID=UPI0027E0B05F|nr:extracellular solute-binding protein [Anaerocolumna sp. MB42-C2]WMJ86258.1 extracellular solute-binding protein [Anaerocolumna sp. MB42-C2]
MKNMKRMLTITVSLMIIAAVLTGCSSNGASESSTVGTKEQTAAASGDVYQVHFYAWTNPDNVKPLEAAFNKEYAGKYEFVYEKLADASTLTINTALASGEKIDVMTQSSQFDLRQRADGGAYMGLKQFFDKEGWDYEDILGDATEETQNMNGDYYSIPYCNNINMVFFNKKMFDAAGVEYPKTGWTWQDFRDTAVKLTSGSGADKVYGAMVDVVGEDFAWDLIARQKLGNFAYYNKDFTASTFDTPQMKESLQYFVDLSLKDKCIVPLDEYTTLKYENDTNGMQGLYNGKYAMWIAPVYGNLYLKSSYGEIPEGTDIGMVNMPTSDGGQSITTCYSSTASIPKSAENPEAAWALLKFITIDHADLFAGPKAMSPGYEFKTEEEATAFNDLIFDHGNRPGFDYDMAMKTMSEPRTLVSKDNTLIQGQATTTEVMDAVMTLVFNGEMGVEEGLAELKTKVDEAIKKDLANMK